MTRRRAIKFLVLFIVISLPVLKWLYQDYAASKMIEKALHQLFIDYCGGDVDNIEVETKLIHEFGFWNTGHNWHAVMSSVKIPELTGHHGNEVISISDFPCSRKNFVLDRETERFIPVDLLFLDSNDKAGISFEVMFLYFIVYLFYFTVLTVYILHSYIRRKRIGKKEA
ncbi:hypothetical protein M3661_14625 [Paenibacillus sp. MER 180]|uniref:hypothetical protein n=1 Tax=unclassified Paenibacillus TaxID=185978 RepID=UPI00080666F7|nr:MULTISPECIES: hypothetical protein [unclassified Paenibacillus]MCM3291364.1 hypothetical protein [Paenibacillus sp. MER 180]OBY76563.1 hypothetical protein BBG47_26370 [Paenibacillus sp. KS1]